MLAIAIILVFVGVAILYLGPADRFVRFAGIVFIGGGILYLVLFLLDASGADTTAILGGGMALAVAPHIHGPHDDDPSLPVAASLADRQPVILAFIVGAVPLVIAAVSALADLFAAVPDWVVPSFTVAGTLTTGLAALWARVRVTPVALPRLDDRTPLVPMVESERT